MVWCGVVWLLRGNGKGGRARVVTVELVEMKVFVLHGILRHPWEDGNPNFCD